MSTDTAPRWHAKRTAESRMVEDVLRRHFAEADAYRHNPASLRVRVTDPQFKGMSVEERDKRVEPILDQLPADTQADIMNLLLMYPGEEKDSFRTYVSNSEFENGESNL